MGEEVGDGKWGGGGGCGKREGLGVGGREGEGCRLALFG